MTFDRRALLKGLLGAPWLAACSGAEPPPPLDQAAAAGVGVNHPTAPSPTNWYTQWGGVGGSAAAAAAYPFGCSRASYNDSWQISADIQQQQQQQAHQHQQM